MLQIFVLFLFCICWKVMFLFFLVAADMVYQCYCDVAQRTSTHWLLARCFQHLKNLQFLHVVHVFVTLLPFIIPKMLQKNNLRIVEVLTTLADLQIHIMLAVTLVVVLHWRWCPLKQDFTEESGANLLYTKKRKGARTHHWGAPLLMILG